MPGQRVVDEDPFRPGSVLSGLHFKSVRTGGGGGFIVNIIFNPKQKDLIYAQTDMGGAYRWNPSTSTWTQLLNWVSTDNWNWTGVESIATDPVNPNNLYIAAGTYTNSWAPTNGAILRSTDQGNTFQITQMPFKMGGNMPGRGMSERLAVDPNQDSILYFGARSGHGLWKSTDSGATWSQVTNFPDSGPYVENASDSNNYQNDPDGIAWVTFDPASGTSGSPTKTIYVGVAENGSGKPNIFRSTDAGATWAAIPGEPTCTGAPNATVTCSDGATWTAGSNGSGAGIGYLPHQGKLDSQGTLYVTYADWDGPYTGGHGAVYKYVPSTNTWTNITPPASVIPGGSQFFGFGGLGVDMLHPGTIVVAGNIVWWPDGMMWRTTNGGTTWSSIWNYSSYPSRTNLFSLDVTNAPWLNFGNTNPVAPVPAVKLGWMMEGLNIDPFNSDRMMYGTGATLYATTNLTAWDSGGTVNIKSTAVGIEEASVLDLVSPPSGTPHLFSIMGDVGGFRHDNLDAAPAAMYSIPYAGTYNWIDFAESNPNFMVRVGTGNPSANPSYHGAAFTYDGGSSWFSSNNDPVAGQGAGTVAAAADASRVVWAGTNAPVSYSTDNGNSWVSSTNIPQGSLVASDRVNAKKFYGYGQGKFWISTDGGATFTASTATGLPSSATNLKALFGHEGDVWVAAGSSGLFHTTDSGTTFTKLASVATADVIGFGMAAPGQSYPALFMSGILTGNTTHALYRSDDGGASWIQISDAQHQYGTIQTITGDPRIYGRVYFGTNGLGAVYGDISGTTNTPTPTSTGATSTPTRTSTPTSSPTRTSTPTSTLTRTFTPTGASPTPTRTNTPTFTPTGATPTRTNTPTFTPTGTTPTRTPTPTNTPTGATPTRTNTPTFTPTGGAACSPVTSTISAPFTFDGAGTFCWQTTSLGTYINSWNLATLTVNGVDFTNKYVFTSALPAKINGYWYVYYVGNYSWSHFEAK